MEKPNRPIGIFDSGIGGLTVAAAIQQLLPQEEIIYYGDTAHLPYGDKSPALIQGYAKDISNFLVECNCKMVVIACNTASVHAYAMLKKSLPKDILLVNVIDPVVAYVAQHHSHQKVGIIGTKGTIASGVYQRKLKKANTTLHVAGLATPLLAPMIEEGFFNDKISQTVINSYLDNKHLTNVQAIILACTHYPLIKKQVQKYYDNKIEVIDSAQIVASYIKNELETTGLLRSIAPTNAPHFYVSDYTDSFENSTKYFFINKIHLEKKYFKNT